MESEAQYYNLIKNKIEESFKNREGDRVYFEVTATAISEKIQDKIPEGKEIIFDFFSRRRPDIIGIIEKNHWSDYIIVEVKGNKITLEDIYQTKKYRDLLEAKFTFLISLKPLSARIKRVCKKIYPILGTRTIYDAFVLVHFDKETETFKEWYPENPFEKDLYWK